MPSNRTPVLREATTERTSKGTTHILSLEVGERADDRLGHPTTAATTIHRSRTLRFVNQQDVRSLQPCEDTPTPTFIEAVMFIAVIGSTVRSKYCAA